MTNLLNTQNNMKKISIILASLAGLFVLTTTTSCNDEWKDEQFAHYISFKAPLDDYGVSPVYMPYTRKGADGTALYGEGVTSYQLPVLVSGTTNNGSNLTVHVAVSDTLDALNYARFQYRTDIYYKRLSDYKNANGDDYAKFSETVDIKSGENIALLPITFNLKGIDLSEKWILPLEIVDNGGSYGYLAHPRKHYAKALMRIYPFNDYSGTYSSTAQLMSNANNTTINFPGVTSRAYVVDENTVFFYAGNSIDELRTDRALYKIYAEFTPSALNPNKGNVRLYSLNPDLNFQTDGKAEFMLSEQQDEVQHYLVHRYLTISNINYSFDDYTLGEERRPYVVTGSLTMERKINTQIPDDDQAIEW